MYLVQILTVVCCILVGTAGVETALPWVDVTNMILIVFNVGGTVFLAGKIRDYTRSYFRQSKSIK